jgi:hypothetical protein
MLGLLLLLSARGKRCEAAPEGVAAERQRRVGCE